MKILILSTLLLLNNLAALAAPTAGYYRIWQGYKKTEFSTAEFLKQLPSFMIATRDIYKGSLNNYLVAIPPANKPAFVPDEFALVAIESESAYQDMRSTPEGKSYGESHWQLFQQGISKSAPYSNYFPSRPTILESNKAYDLIGKPIDWRQGHSSFFIGIRKQSLSTVDFLTRLSTHVKTVSETLQSKGLVGYIIIANENYEVAYMNWTSEKAMTDAFATAAGKWVNQDGSEIMEILQWSQAEAFSGQSVQPEHFYNTDECSF